MTAEPRHILVLANETVAGRRCSTRSASGQPTGPSGSPSLPQNEPRAGYVVYEESRRSSAERRLRRTLDLLHEAGIAARGASSTQTRCRRSGTRCTSTSRTRSSSRPTRRSTPAGCGASRRPRQA